MDTKKLARREGAKKRLILQLDGGVKTIYEVGEDDSRTKKTVALDAADLQRISSEIQRLDFFIQGGRIARKNKEGEVVKEEPYFIDIFTISTSYVKRSERKKNKGKSTKKLKHQRIVSLLKSVKAQPGMILAYKEGKMGLSPKTHKFQIRKEEINSR